MKSWPEKEAMLFVGEFTGEGNAYLLLLPGFFVCLPVVKSLLSLSFFITGRSGDSRARKLLCTDKRIYG